MNSLVTEETNNSLVVCSQLSGDYHCDVKDYDEEKKILWMSALMVPLLYYIIVVSMFPDFLILVNCNDEVFKFAFLAVFSIDIIIFLVTIFFSRFYF